MKEGKRNRGGRADSAPHSEGSVLVSLNKRLLWVPVHWSPQEAPWWLCSCPKAPEYSGRSALVQGATSRQGWAAWGAHLAFSLDSRCWGQRQEPQSPGRPDPQPLCACILCLLGRHHGARGPLPMGVASPHSPDPADLSPAVEGGAACV